MLRFNLFTVLFFSSLAAVACGDEAETVRQAVSRISPRLVRIDTIGGHEKVGDQFANEGTSTGFLLDADGYVITGAFHFLHDPSSILLRLADGSKKIARKVCNDRNRMLTLLKVEGLDAAFAGQMPEIRDKASIPVGSRCIAVGVALSQDEPNLAHGIVSGKDRIWGKAIQTDAAVGPNNYGGPLVDLEGKLLGLLVPLSMMSSDVAAGAETYDAGVGMAVPFEDIIRLLPRMKEGLDLEPGRVGIEFKENRTFIGEPVIDTVQPDSPAAKAGLKKGDRIRAIDGNPMATALQVTMNFHLRYTGETVAIRFQRNGDDREVSLTTVKPRPRNPSAAIQHLQE